jgi:hypothetical protein
VKRKLIERRITVGLSKLEVEHLEAYCEAMCRNYSDVIRDCIRKLKIPDEVNPNDWMT